MIKKLVSIKLLAAILLFNGCAGILPGNDPVVVDAEKSTVIAVEAVNSFLKLERDNQVIVKAQAPAIHTYANYVRTNGKDWIASARYLTGVYKQNRTAANKANLQTALAVLTAAIGQITQYTTQINQLH